MIDKTAKIHSTAIIEDGVSIKRMTSVWDHVHIRFCYTFGMKTAVSIPDEVFEKVERLARRSRRSRSEVYSSALREYVARHAHDEVREAMDRVCEAVSERENAFVKEAGRRILETTEW